ncbi:hypothetical protein BCR33DRAFT_770179 [Rhizoclosmatium globosum]|uniref:C2H2-type domain-containing protein n=1 Tax=Rhizoclosmatium globosum TaxID=329046 RepID=A0A1Y2BPP1_9FUNG|nr:hypothetical protein BCR33DRAFT_770179 [Rhizoclosmatium globosum]|eukprot:ORY36700.1 hypothetical protein BCR33DRAFT_770179 [Rhizoclosmatium globosum]
MSSPPATSTCTFCRNLERENEVLRDRIKELETGFGTGLQVLETEFQKLVDRFNNSSSDAPVPTISTIGSDEVDEIYPATEDDVGRDLDDPSLKPVISRKRKAFDKSIDGLDVDMIESVKSDPQSFPFKCTRCDKRFQTQDKARTHIYDRHSPQCTVVFISGIEATITRQADNRFHCPCQVFATQNLSSMRSHARLRCEGRGLEEDVEATARTLSSMKNSIPATSDTVDPSPTAENTPERIGIHGPGSVKRHVIISADRLTHDLPNGWNLSSPECKVVFSSGSELLLKRDSTDNLFHCPCTTFSSQSVTQLQAHTNKCAGQVPSSSAIDESKSASFRPFATTAVPSGMIPTLLSDGSRNEDGYASWVDLVRLYCPSADEEIAGKMVSQLRTKRKFPRVHLEPVLGMETVDWIQRKKVLAIPKMWHQEFVESVQRRFDGSTERRRCGVCGEAGHNKATCSMR